MTPEQAAAFVAAQTAFFNCRVAGMQAENQHRLANGWVAAYGEDAFDKVANEFGASIGHNAVITLFGEAK